MNTDEHDDLWRLLGKAKTREVSPFFARNVLREIRLRKQGNAGLIFRLIRSWRFAAVTVSVVILAGIGFAPGIFRRQTVSQPQSALVAVDYDTINHLDELLAYEENSIWLDNSSY